MGFIPYDIDLLGIHFRGYLNTCMMVFVLLYIYSLMLLTLHAYLEMATTMIIYQIIENLGAKKKRKRKKGFINKICNWIQLQIEIQFGFHSWDMEPKIYLKIK
jgi:hypothetical protein